MVSTVFYSAEPLPRTDDVLLSDVFTLLYIDLTGLYAAIHFI